MSVVRNQRAAAVKLTDSGGRIADIILESNKNGRQWFLEDEWYRGSGSGRAYGVG